MYNITLEITETMFLMITMLKTKMASYEALNL